MTTPSPRDILVRPAQPGDEHDIIRLVTALAHYEKLQPPDPQAQQRLLRDALGPNPRIQIFLGEHAGQAAAYAIVIETYSSFLALPTLYLEDLFVMPESRGVGLGKAMFMFLIEEAKRRGCGRMEWQVLDWNMLARDFYARLGAQHMDNWCNYRVTADQFDAILARR